jgi:acyl dehydratase
MNQQTQTSIVREFSQVDFDQFARLSGDDNPIHTDPVFSASTRFGRTVAHGLLLCSVLRGLIEKLFPGCRLSGQSVMFPAPTFTGEPMQFTVMETCRNQSGSNTLIDIELQVKRINDGVVTCQGDGKVEL